MCVCGGGGGDNTDIFHTSVTPENDGHRTWFDSIDPKQSYKHANGATTIYTTRCHGNN